MNMMALTLQAINPCVVLALNLLIGLVWVRPAKFWIQTQETWTRFHRVLLLAELLGRRRVFLIAGFYLFCF